MKLNNAQRFVFTALLIVIVLDFGSLTKLQTLWGLAFNANTQPVVTPYNNQPVTNSAGRVISTTPDGRNGIGVAGEK